MKITDFKGNLRQIALRCNTLLEDLVTKKELNLFLSNFKKKYVSCELIRIGGKGDGGYLLPNILKDISYCFSLGVDNVANFENELAEKYNIKSFLADGSIERPPIENKKFKFIPKFIGAVSNHNTITLSDWIKESIGNDNENKILQMDIESGEYDVLMLEGPETLKSFSLMIIEFHGVNRLFQNDFFKMFSLIFGKIYKNFSICHVHPNNCSGILKLKGIEVPSTLEITFINNKLLDHHANNDKIILPHKLDEKNVAIKKNLIMPKIWWDK